jgi:hypothetical protein
MENQVSQPTLELPNIPDDFETTAGTSRRDFAQALFDLLESARILGITQASPTPYDLAAIVSDIETLEAGLAAVSKIRRVITVSGVNNGEVTVPFQSVGTDDYQVDVAFVWTSGGAFPAIQWAIVGGSKTATQVKIRCDGTAATFDLEVTIIVN